MVFAAFMGISIIMFFHGVWGNIFHICRLIHNLNRVWGTNHSAPSASFWQAETSGRTLFSYAAKAVSCSPLDAFNSPANIYMRR